MATLGEQSVGSTVKVKINGTATDFLVVHNGKPSSVYDSSCDGVWLLMTDLYTSRAFDSTNGDYASSDIAAYLNGTFLNLIDSNVKGIVKQANIPYTNGSGSLMTGSSGFSTKVFLLSHHEVGLTTSYANAEGAALSYFNGAANSKRIAKLSGKANAWWLRSPMKMMLTYPLQIDTTGGAAYTAASTSLGVRPAFILPTDANVADDGTVSAGGTKAISGTVCIGGTTRTLTGEGYVNIGGTLRPLTGAQVNIGGVLKTIGG